MYYRELDIDSFDVIVNKCLTFVKKQTSVFFREENASLYWLSSELLINCPEINEAFKSYNLSCVAASVYVMWDPSHTSIHRDSFRHNARINIPLLNCSGTFTNFYENCHFEKWVNPNTKNVSYVVTNTDYELVDRVEMKKATVIRVASAHSVYMPEEHAVPRINLSLAFDRDPEFLL